MRDEYENPLNTRYASREMKFLFSPQYKFETWRKLWIILAESEMELGLPITQEQIDELKAHAKDINFDVKGNPVIYYVTSDNHLTGPDGGARIHSVARWTGKKWTFTDFAESTHCYDSGSLWVDGKVMTIITPSDPGPQLWGTGGEMVMWKSFNGY